MITNSILLCSEENLCTFLRVYSSNVVHQLCRVLPRLNERKEFRISFEVLTALTRLLELDISHSDEFSEEASVCVMVDECEGFINIEAMQMSDLNEELKDKARQILDTYYTLED